MGCSMVACPAFGSSCIMVREEALYLQAEVDCESRDDVP